MALAEISTLARGYSLPSSQVPNRAGGDRQTMMNDVPADMSWKTTGRYSG